MTRIDENRDTEYKTTFDFGGTQPLSSAVVFAVCAISGEDPRRAPPLHDVIDPDSLDRLFRKNHFVQNGPVRLTFTYNGYDVTIDSEGWILVTAPRYGT
jgi:hypothetical protein